MKRLVPEVPPVGTPDSLVDYLMRRFRSVDEELSKPQHYIPTDRMPTKAAIGEVFYFSKKIDGTQITEEGLWLNKSTGWTKIG